MSETTRKPAGSGPSRVDILAVVAIFSVISLIDSELVAYGLPGIFAATEFMHLPAFLEYAAIGVLSILVLWLSIALGRQIWRVEHQLNRPPESC